jgi:hypothetical protein
MAKTYYSTVFDKSPDAVWAVARDFNGLATWFNPPVTESRIEGGKSGDTVGAVRTFKLGGAWISERLVAHSDIDRSYTYRFVEPPFSVRNYEATLRVMPITDGGRSFVAWWATFDPNDAAQYDHWVAFFANEIFAPALASMRAYLG